MNENDKKNEESPAVDAEVVNEAPDNVESINKNEVKPTELEVAQKETDKWKNDFLYLRAEFDNYKKQVIKDRSDQMKYGSERVMVSMLEVLDNLDRALQMELTSDNIKSFKDGVELTATEFRKVFAKYSVEEIECLNLPFDPTLHEALSSEETDDVKEGHISQVYRKAFKLHERVIRPAQVVVAKPVSK